MISLLEADAIGNRWVFCIPVLDFWPLIWRPHLNIGHIVDTLGVVLQKGQHLEQWEMSFFLVILQTIYSAKQRQIRAFGILNVS